MKNDIKLLMQVQVYHFVFTLSLCLIVLFLLYKVFKTESDIINGKLYPKHIINQNVNFIDKNRVTSSIFQIAEKLSNSLEKNESH